MKKSYPVTIDKQRSLRYGFVAIDMIEEALDKPISLIDFQNIKIKEVAVLVWAGLSHEDSTLTPKKILELFDEHDVDYIKVMQIVSEAIVGAFGFQNEKK